MIIGVTGKNCAGKDLVAEFLEERGFERHSLSDALREELKNRGIEETRDNLILLGNELRNKEGPSTLAERIKRRIRGKNAVIVSIRNPEEVESLKRMPSFHLLGIDAPVEIRYARERQRGRGAIVAQTLEEFKSLEAKENTADKNSQQLDACLSEAEEIIVNDSSKEELLKKVKLFLKKIDKESEKKAD